MAYLTEVLNAEQTVPDGKHEFRTPPRGHVRFADVSFGYSPERETLHGIDVEAQPGDVIAIVGPTGAGKSTLVSLIPRFYDPARGKVLIDDTDVRTLKLTALRARHFVPPIELVDVDVDPELVRRWGLKVPVLLLDGALVCASRLDAPELLRLLRL